MKKDTMEGCRVFADVDENTDKTLKRLSKAQGIPVQAVLQQAVTRYIEKQGKITEAMKAAHADLMRTRKRPPNPQFKYYTMKIRLDIFDQANLSVLMDKKGHGTLSEYLAMHFRDTLRNLYGRMDPEEVKASLDRLGTYFKDKDQAKGGAK